jgi:5-methylcytosine-specific restriction endonuclease McrA
MDTLVLSASWEPVARVTWQRAVALLFSGKVEVVEEYQDRTVRSVTLELRVPSVVRFLRSLRARRRGVKLSRENVWARDHGRCQYCGRAVMRPEATFDHVVPRAQGGHTAWENVVICCVPCNQRKGGRTPAQAGMRLASSPVRPRSVPDAFRMTFTFHKGMPESWRHWLRSAVYWNGELAEEG